MKKYAELDMLRGFAIMAVILIHVTAIKIGDNIHLNFGEIYPLVVNQLSKFAVPAFLILSGLGLSISSKLSSGYLVFLKSRLGKLLPLYFLWSFIYFVIFNNEYSILNFFRGLIFGTNYYHLYYVPLTIILYILYPFLMKIGKTNKGLIITLLITITSQMSIYFIDYPFLINDRNIFNWLFYFVFGIWLAKGFDRSIIKIKNNRLLIIILFTISSIIVSIESLILFNNFGRSLGTTQMRPSIIVFSLLFVFMILSIKWRNTFSINVISILSKNSYGIYLSHLLVLAVFQKISTQIGLLDSPFYIISAFVLVTAISLIVTSLMNNFINMLNHKIKSKVETNV